MIGCVVQNEWGDLGVVTRQMGVVDRWWVVWATGEQYALNRYKLEVIA